jgi:VWFA-related protein
MVGGRSSLVVRGTRTRIFAELFLLVLHLEGGYHRALGRGGEVRMNRVSSGCQFLLRSLSSSASLVVTLLFLSATGAAPAQSSAPAANPTAAGQTSTSQTSPTQTSPAQPASTQTTTGNAAEMSSQDVAATFRVNVKLVLARVVVRDANGHAVGNLQKDDFELLDKGKPQVISQFEVEQPGSLAAKERKTSDEYPQEAKSPGNIELHPVPERFVAYLFDDEHLQFADLAHVRDAAQRHFKTLRPTDRAAVFTTSGKNMLDFTDDRTKLQDALLHLMPIAQTGNEINPCPDISYYMADLIVNQHNPEAIRVATQDYISCSQTAVSAYSARTNLAPIAQQLAPQLISSTAQTVLSRGDMATHLSLGVLKDVVNRMSRMPGQRNVILVSPGFLTPQMEYEFTDIVDRAVHAQVVVGTMDARGLYVLIPGGDASKRGGTIDPDPKESSPTTDPGVLMSQYEAQAASANSDILASLANSTGGTFVHNTNDFDEAFRRVGETPEYTYLLGFAPQNLKPDGSFHGLKVRLKNPAKLTVQARLGYFAPKKLQDPSEQAKQEIEDAMFSQEELQGLPLDLHTQFFKESEAGAKLTVLAHMDARRMHFRKAEGRNDNEITFVSALFNQNGDFLEGNKKIVTLRLKDDTVEHKLGNGITMKTSFDVKPGSYLVRVVVRDEEGQLSAESGAVEIP